MIPSNADIIIHTVESANQKRVREVPITNGDVVNTYLLLLGILGYC